MNRNTRIDYLRVFSSFAVIVIHVCGNFWYSMDIGSFEWSIVTVYNTSVRWAVPVFVMISGALLCGHHRKMKLFYKKNILRLIIAFVFWGGVVFSIRG